MLGEKKERMRWSIATYVRLKPLLAQSASSPWILSSSPSSSLEYQISELKLPTGHHRSALDIQVPLDSDPSYVHNYTSGRVGFEFDKVFDKLDSQETVFELTTRGN